MLYVTFEINFPLPHSIPEAQLTLLEQILPARQPLPALIEPEEVVLTDVDYSRQARQNAAMEEDEDMHQHQGPGVQCAQQ